MKTFKSVLKTLLLFILVSCNSRSPANDPRVQQQVVQQLSEEDLKEQLKQKECNDPVSYLTGDLKYTPIFKGLLSMKVNGLKLKCTIKNSATAATFKNIVAHITFKSQTGAVVLEQDFTVYDYVAPNSEISYTGDMDITNQQYNDISSFDWNIKSADCQ